jgi:hypothetical protein
MTEIIAECTRPHVQGKYRVTAGTHAAIVGATIVPTPSLRLQIRKLSAKGR